MACGANELAILVPCHRVVEKSGGLGGYAGGTETKERLLELEFPHGKKNIGQAVSSLKKNDISDIV